MKRRLLLLSLYAMFFVVAFLFCFWLTLPWDRIEELVTHRLEAATGYEVTIGEFDSHWFTGVEIEDLVLRKPLTAEQKEALKKAREERARARADGIDKEGGAGPNKEGEGDGEAQGSALPPAQEAGKQGNGAGAEAAGAGAGSGDVSAGAGLDGAAAPQQAISSEEGEKKPAFVPPLPIRIPHVSARIALLPLFVGRAVADFSAQMVHGSLRGSAGRGPGSYHLSLHVESVRLTMLPGFAELVALPIKGVVDVDGELDIFMQDMPRTEGRLLLDLRGLELGPCEIPLPKGSMFPSFDLSTPTKVGDLEIELVVGEEQARDPDAALVHIERFEHKGKDKDLELKAEGDLILLPDLGRSRPDIGLGVSFSASFVKRNHLGMVLASRQVKRYIKDDFLGISLKGSLAQPQPKLSSPTWGRSRKYLRARDSGAGAGKRKAGGGPEEEDPKARSRSRSPRSKALDRSRKERSRSSMRERRSGERSKTKEGEEDE